MGYKFSSNREGRSLIPPTVGLGLILCLAAPLVLVANPVLEASLETVGPVVVEIYENLAPPPPSTPEEAKAGWEKKYIHHKARDIDLTGLTPTFSYTESAFGFPRLPTKFSRNALALDYSEPFALKAGMKAALPAGSYRFRLRSKGSARFAVDGEILATTKRQVPNRSSNDELPPPPKFVKPPLRPASVPHQDVLVTVDLDGGEHEFTLIALIGGYGLIPDPAELSLSYSRDGELDRLLGGAATPFLTNEGWEAYEAKVIARHSKGDVARRRAVDDAVEAAWARRHRRVGEWLATQRPVEVPRVGSQESVNNDIDRFVQVKLEEAGVRPMPLTADLEFLRRLSLDVIGVIPTADEIRAYLKDPVELRRQRAIERLLNEPGWADHWIPYWQDVLAENPSILKPDLNNSGPFRWWLHQAFSDDLPFDRVVTELIEMEGSLYKGAPRGFAMASLNDAPMAAKADILSQAFLGQKLSCARCHDAPFHPFKQKDLFSVAALLDGNPIELPEASTVPVREGARKPYVQISLKPGDQIDAHWPFQGLSGATVVAEPPSNTSVASRHRLASLIVDPQNGRFGEVMVNRVWKRYVGRGLVEPAHDWFEAEASHPRLLRYLSRQFVESGYDLKHLARLIFSSHVYQRKPDPAAGESSSERGTLLAGPFPRRLSAEQLVDSLHLAVGKSLDCEDLNLNPLGDRPLRQFVNMGTPQRAWEMTALSNERDRPSLALPRAQALVDVLTTFGWRQARQDPATARDDGPSPMQTLMLANGPMGTRITRLSDDSGFTRLALEDRPLDELVGETYLRLLSRPPSADETNVFVDYLQPTYADRRVAGMSLSDIDLSKKTDKRVSWANHMSEESNLIRMEEERTVRMGDDPTTVLQAAFRERYEDVIWALANSPEFKIIP
jgi:hypothetical protein